MAEGSGLFTQEFDLGGGGTFLPSGGGDSVDSFLGLGGDTGIGDIDWGTGGAVDPLAGHGIINVPDNLDFTINGLDPDFAGGGTPVNLGNGTYGGSFGTIGQQGASLFKSIAGAVGGVVNPISNAVFGRPLLRTGGTAAQQKAAQTQNMLVLGALGLGAWLLVKKL